MLFFDNEAKYEPMNIDRPCPYCQGVKWIVLSDVKFEVVSDYEVVAGEEEPRL